MLARKCPRHSRIVLLEQWPRLGRDDRVLVAEKPVAQSAVVVSYVVELVSLGFLEMRHRLLCDVELRLAVLAAIEPFVLANVQDVVLL